MTAAQSQILPSGDAARRHAHVGRNFLLALKHHYATRLLWRSCSPSPTTSVPPPRPYCRLTKAEGIERARRRGLQDRDALLFRFANGAFVGVEFTASAFDEPH